jgi:hypothetical protein
VLLLALLLLLLAAAGAAGPRLSMPGCCNPLLLLLLLLAAEEPLGSGSSRSNACKAAGMQKGNSQHLSYHNLRVLQCQLLCSCRPANC